MIRNAILAELTRRNWTRYRLAKEVGIHTQSVYRMLNNGRGMHVANAERMMAVLGLGVTPGISEPDRHTHSSSLSSAATTETAAVA